MASSDKPILTSRVGMIDFDSMKKNGYVIKYYESESSQLKTEIQILRMLAHPNLVRLANLVEKNDMGTGDLFVGLVIQREDSDLMDYLDKFGSRLTNKIRLRIGTQIANGLVYLHQNLILHTDLKPDNILITGNQIKITDFGSSVFVNKKTLSVKTSHLKCTPTHRPPEGFVCVNTKSFTLDLKFDMWSFGIIMYELWSGCPIYLQRIIPAYNKNVADNVYEDNLFQTILTDAFHKDIRLYLPKIFYNCISIGSEYRPTAQCILDGLCKFSI